MDTRIDTSTGGGVRVAWGVEHRNNKGELICRQAMVATPKPPTCLRPKCLFKYLWDAWVYALVCTYHARRSAYAEANRPDKKVILERYRTGEPSPKTLWQAIHANIKISCPVCRKSNKDPFLFKGGNDEEIT